MNLRISALSDEQLHRLQQAVKWTVYTLLIINFVLYVLEDWNRAVHSLTPASPFLDWTSEFANTLDLTAWFLLLAMLELETYVLEELEGWRARIVHGIRLICFVVIAHTVFAYTNAVIDYAETKPVENVSSLCDMVDDNVAYAFSLVYTAITVDNCSELSTASEFFWLADNPLVTDADGLARERDLAMADLIEALIWLVVILAIEITVRMQRRGVTDGIVISTANWSKIVLYLVLAALATWWATLGHWLYFWDELLWIGGFSVIEMNLSEWRDELLEAQDELLQPEVDNA